jgi:hypothetical protein
MNFGDVSDQYLRLKRALSKTSWPGIPAIHALAAK